MKKIWLINLSFTSFLLGFFLFTPVLVKAAEFGPISGSPAYPTPDNPRTKSIFFHNLTPGAIQEEGVVVKNGTAFQKTILVYAADSVPSSDGGFACAQLLDEQKEVGTWIVVSKSEITLDSGGSETVPFTIKIPQNADVGEHNGCILLQEKKDPTAMVGKTGAIISTRLGLRVLINVPGDSVRKVEIAGFKVSPKGSDYLLHPMIKNVGNVSVSTDVSILTKDFLGNSVAENGGKFQVLRGTTWEGNFDFVRPFWGGWFNSTLTADYDASPEATLKGPSDERPKTHLIGPTVWFFCMPTPAGAVVELAILLLILVLVLRIWLAARRRKWVKDRWVSYGVKAREDLNAIAARCGVSWKLLAKVNRLRPPYILKAGDKIKIPPKRR